MGDAFSRAWYKLCHRDLGPVQRCLGPMVAPPQLWQDPIPENKGYTLSDADVSKLKELVLASGLTTSQLVKTAWASASTYRQTDHRGGANGGRIRLEPQIGWEVNAGAADVLAKYAEVAKAFGKEVSMADLVVLGGVAGVEKALKDAGKSVAVPFTPGRMDTTQELTEVASFGVLEPSVDGFRNFLKDGQNQTPETLLVNRAHLLGLSAPEMTVLVGGLRVLGTNSVDSSLGVFTDKVGVLSNDWFVNLLDMDTEWSCVKTASGERTYVFEGKDRATGAKKWEGSQVDMVFGHNSQLRALAEYYATADSSFAEDFVAAWTKVMDSDRFDVRGY